MPITIAQRYRPFSHCPGIKCLLPGTSYRLQIFPTWIKVADLSGTTPLECGEFKVDFKGPVDKFTVQLDLEKGFISVSGETAQGYARYRLKLGLEGIEFIPEKGDLEPQILPIKRTLMKTAPTLERLALGSHKAQNWTKVKQRHDLAEIFPIWLKLGQMTPFRNASLEKGSLLSQCENSKEPYQDFLNLWKAGFEGILSPRNRDEQHQGFTLEPLPNNTSPLALLSVAAQHLRNLFVFTSEKGVSLLPNLPQQFHSGRMTGIQLPGLGTLDMEWSKHQMRRVIFEASDLGQLQLHFPKGLKTMRLSHHSHRKGKVLPTSSSIDILPKERYLLDRFC